MLQNAQRKPSGRPKGRKATAQHAITVKASKETQELFAGLAAFLGTQKKDLFHQALNELAQKTGYRPRHSFLGCLAHLRDPERDLSFEAIEAATADAWKDFGVLPEP